MGLISAGGMLVTFHAADRARVSIRHVRFESDRANAQDPTTANDPVGRTVI